MALDVYKDWLGIPDGPRPPDHYTLLRLVQFEDNAEKVRANYRKLNGHVRKYASGQYSMPSQELLNELAKAMLLLTDPEPQARIRRKPRPRISGRAVTQRQPHDRKCARRTGHDHQAADQRGQRVRRQARPDCA